MQKFSIAQAQDDIAELENRLDGLNNDAKPIREQLGNIDRQRAVLVKQRDELRAKVRAMKEAPRVSDHAVIRYLERKHDFCFDNIKKEILTPAIRNAMDLGADGVKTTEGTWKLKGKTVVTFIGKDQQ